MSPHSMPKDLMELENRLRIRRDGEPTSDLRDRVMRAVAAELALPEQYPAVRPKDNGYWCDNRCWAAVAAAVLIVLNLSMITASQDEFSVSPARSAHQMSAELQALSRFETQQEGTFK